VPYTLLAWTIPEVTAEDVPGTASADLGNPRRPRRNARPRLQASDEVPDYGFTALKGRPGIRAPRCKERLQDQEAMVNPCEAGRQTIDMQAAARVSWSAGLQSS